MESKPLSGYQVYLSRVAEKQLCKLHKDIQQTIIKTLHWLVDNETHSLDIKKLSGYEKLYRLRVGDFRIVYEAMHKKVTVHVIYIGHRKNIYDDLKRLIGG